MLHVYRFHFQVSQVTGAAFQGSYRNIHGTEQINGVLPQLVKPHLGIFRLADNDHFLLFELMDSVYALSLPDRGRLFPYGSKENSWSESWAALLPE